MRCVRLPLIVAALLVPAVAEAQTTRIETRPFYGATVTLEEGVRVFRPLPPHDRVIINPGGVTPLTLVVDDSRRRRGSSAAAASSSSGGVHAGGGFGGGAVVTEPPHRAHDGVAKDTPRSSVGRGGAPARGYRGSHGNHGTHGGGRH